MTNLLITGGGGFIGSALAARFVADGASVVSMARTASRAGGLRSELKNCLSVIAPIERTGITNLLTTHSIDVVIHCAGSATVWQAQSNPHEDFMNSVSTVAEVLAAVRDSGRARSILFVYVSSASVYGDRGAAALVETLQPEPISAYGYGKFLSEILVRQYVNQFGVSGLVIRPFSVYGEGLKKQVVFDLCCKLIGNPMDIMLPGSGLETRDFLHVDDLTAAVARLVGARTVGTVNIGTGIATSVAQLASIVAQGLSVQTKFTFDGAGRTTDPVHLLADVKKLSALGFSPSVSLQVGIGRVCKAMLTTGGMK